MRLTEASSIRSKQTIRTIETFFSFRFFQTKNTQDFGARRKKLQLKLKHFVTLKLFCKEPNQKTRAKLTKALQNEQSLADNWGVQNSTQVCLFVILFHFILKKKIEKAKKKKKLRNNKLQTVRKANTQKKTSAPHKKNGANKIK